MTISEIRALALSLPLTEEADHWGKSSYRVNGRIYLIVQPDGRTITVKTTKEARELYAASDPAAYSVPESFSNLNYMHIRVEHADAEEAFDLIRLAWRSVAPKKAVKAWLAQQESQPKG